MGNFFDFLKPKPPPPAPEIPKNVPVTNGDIEIVKGDYGHLNVVGTTSIRNAQFDANVDTIQSHGTFRIGGL